MMNFEDIVDMDWVDSHTTLENSGEYCFDYQPNFLLEQPATPPQQPAMIEPEIKIEPLTSMPTTEQIKQLIEIAKRQLALREQLQQQQQQTQEAQQQVLQDQPLFLSTQTAAEVQTAAPSTIFAPPPPPPVAPTSSTTPTMPALSPTTITSTDMTLPPLPPLLTDLEMFDQPKQSSLSSNSHADTTSTSSMGRRDSLASMTEESISLEAYAEADGIDLKKLTPKERRQLRNKISARNFRVRRKEYISTLEGQVNDHKMAAEALKEKLQKVEDENKKLRKEMDSLKRQNQILQQQQQKTPQSPRMIQKPNLNKDISILGTKATDSYRQQDSCILVSNAVMPVWDYKSILHQKIPQPRVPDYMEKCVGQFLYSVVQLANTMPRGTNQEQDFKKPLLPDDRDFSCSLNEKHYNTTASSSSYSLSSHLSSKSSSSSLPASYMEDLYDFLIQSALINSSNTDKSFWWWDNNNTSQSQTM